MISPQEDNAKFKKKTQIVNSFYMINAKNVQINFILIKIGNVYQFHLFVDSMMKTVVYVQAVIPVILFHSRHKVNALLEIRFLIHVNNMITKQVTAYNALKVINLLKLIQIILFALKLTQVFQILVCNLRTKSAQDV